MINKRTLAIVVSTIIVSHAASAEELKEIAAISLSNDYRIEQLHNKFLQDIEKQNEISGIYLPKINLESNTSYNISDTKNIYSEYDNFSSSNGIGFNYALYDPERDSIENIQTLGSAISYLDYESYKQEIIYNISSVYYLVLRNQKILDTDKEQQKSMQKQYEKINNMFKVGLRTAIDVAEVKSKLDQANANVIISQNNLENALSQLYTYTGQNGLKPEDVVINDKLRHFEDSKFEFWLDNLQTHNFLIKKAKISKHISKENIKKTEQSNDLSVSLNGGLYNSYNHRSSDHFENSANVSVSIALPIYDGGVNNSQIKQATIDYTNANLDLNYLNRQLKPKLEIVLNELKSIDRQIDALKEVVESTKLSQQSIQYSYDVGVRDIVDVLDATTEYYISLKNLSNTEYEYLHKQNELLFLTGMLTIKEL